jgi:tetratricopeptide (TPR) repeat protein
MRCVGFLLLLAGTLAADVVVLKDGKKFGGKVVEKPAHYEVTGDGGLRTFLKDEVEKVLTEPKALLGDSEKLLDEAKQDYQKALEIADPAQQNPKLKEAIAKLTKAREAYAGARELFPEDKFSDLDLKLVQVMQLMRLLRERVGSEIAGKPGPRPVVTAPAPVAPAPALAPPPPPPPAPVDTSLLSLDEAFAILLDPAKRNNPALRSVARDAFRGRRASLAGGADLATAAMIFLSRPDADWKVEASLAEYFARPWLKETAKLSPAVHLEAAKFLAEKFPAAKKAGADEALALFATGHLAHAAPGPEADRLGQAVGLVVRGGVPGTPEGHAALDLLQWIAAGDYDLAALAYAREYRPSADTPVVRFLWAYALLRQAQAKKRGFEKPAAAYAAVRPTEAAFRDHAAALEKSVRNAAVCTYCGGEARVRCTGCHGKKEVRDDCPRCKGVGAVNTGGRLAPCAGCQGRGYLKLQRCSQCKDGFPECRVCDRKPRTPPAVDDFFLSSKCSSCEGSGSAFRGAAVPCRGCMGLGVKLTPRADSSKILP